MQVLVIGGPKALVEGNFGRKLKGAGVTVAHHWSCERNGAFPKIDRFPADVQGVIVLRELVSHGASESSKEAARKFDLPYALVSRKWRLAEGVLRQVGIVRKDATPKPQPLRLEAPALKPENPVVTPLFSSTTPPTNGEQEPMAKGHSDAKPDKPDKKVVQEIIRDAILQQPWDVLTPQKVAETVALVMDNPDMDVLLPETASACKAVQDQWRSAASPNAVNERAGLVRRWLDHCWTTAKNGGEYPTTAFLRNTGPKIFGIQPPWDEVKLSRMRVFGSWADNLILLGPAKTYFQDKGGVGDLDTLIRDGAVPAIKVPKLGLMTSHTAIDTYLNSAPVKLKKASSTPPPVVEEQIVAATVETATPNPPVPTETPEWQDVLDTFRFSDLIRIARQHGVRIIIEPTA